MAAVTHLRSPMAGEQMTPLVIHKPRHEPSPFTLFVHKTPACVEARTINDELGTRKVPTHDVISRDSVPPYIVGVPSLSDASTRTIYQGADCIAVLSALREEIRRELSDIPITTNEKPTLLETSSSSEKQQLNVVPNMDSSIVSSISEKEGKITENDIAQIMKERQQLISGK